MLSAVSVTTQLMCALTMLAKLTADFTKCTVMYLWKCTSTIQLSLHITTASTTFCKMCVTHTHPFPPPAHLKVGITARLSMYGGVGQLSITQNQYAVQYRDRKHESGGTRQAHNKQPTRTAPFSKVKGAALGGTQTHSFLHHSRSFTGEDDEEDYDDENLIIMYELCISHVETSVLLC